jgi:Aspartyl protease
VIRSLSIILLLCLAACSQSPTSTPQTCRINKAADVPVHLVGGALLATAALDQHPVQMIVDTGVFSTTVTPEIVRVLGLPADPHISTRLLGIGDEAARPNTDVHSFAVGDQVWSDRGLVTSPLERTFDVTPPVAGRIGTDYLAHFDVELDMPHQRLKLWQVQGCSDDFAFANLPHWPMKLERNGASLMLAAASLDGQPYRRGSPGVPM